MSNNQRSSLWAATLKPSSEPRKVEIKTDCVSQSDAEKAFKSEPDASQRFTKVPDDASAFFMK